MQAIGTIRTPYLEIAPRQPPEKETGDFWVELLPKYVPALQDLELFRYFHLIFCFDRPTKEPQLYAHPPWAGGRRVGLFASRSPHRPNPIGLSVVRLLRVEENKLIISPVDILDGTPLLDIKPYIKRLDAKEDANNGWLDDPEVAAKLEAHRRGER